MARITNASNDDLVRVVEGPVGTPVQGVGVEHDLTVANLLTRRLDAVSDVAFAARVSSDAFNRLEIAADGTTRRGSGSVAPSAVSAGSLLMPMVRTGNLYYRIPTGVIQSTATLVDGAGSYIPLMVPVACTLTECGVEVVTTAGAAGSVVRLGIYADHSTTPGIPQTLIQDFGTVATTSTGNQVITGLSVQLQPFTTYWLVNIAQGSPATQPTVRIFSASAAYGSTSLAAYMWSAYQTFGSTLGALPAQASTNLSIGSGAGSPSLVWVRLSY